MEYIIVPENNEVCKGKWDHDRRTEKLAHRDLDYACPCANLGQFKNQNKYNRLQPVK